MANYCSWCGGKLGGKYRMFYKAFVFCSSDHFQYHRSQENEELNGVLTESELMTKNSRVREQEEVAGSTSGVQPA